MTPERDTRLAGLRIFRQVDWARRFPGLLQGITARADAVTFNSSAPAAPAASVPADSSAGGDGWELLRGATGLARIARCRQVHSSSVVTLQQPIDAGVEPLADADALVTDRRDTLLVVTVADCIPVFMVDPARRLLGLAHAGWRGTAAGVAEATLAALRRLGGEPDSLYVHLGPAICGDCYEVGPEVPEALGLGGGASAATHVDLRRQVADRLLAAGVDRDRLTLSTACTRHDPGDYYSYRGGDRGRRMCAFLGWPAS